MDHVAQDEYEDQGPNPDNERLQVYRDQLAHPYDWLTFKQLLSDVTTRLRAWPRVQHLVVIGTGAGFEAATIAREVPSLQVVTNLDIRLQMIRLVPATVDHVGKTPTRHHRVVADFNALPFRPCDPDVTAVAFRCLHHAEQIWRVIMELRRVFQRIVIVEPVWTAPVRLSRWGFANRPEHGDHKPQRIDPRALRHPEWRVAISYHCHLSRDRLPGLTVASGLFPSKRFALGGMVLECQLCSHRRHSESHR